MRSEADHTTQVLCQMYSTTLRFFTMKIIRTDVTMAWIINVYCICLWSQNISSRSRGPKNMPLVRFAHSCHIFMTSQTRGNILLTTGIKA